MQEVIGLVVAAAWFCLSIADLISKRYGNRRIQMRFFTGEFWLCIVTGMLPVLVLLLFRNQISWLTAMPLVIIANTFFHEIGHMLPMQAVGIPWSIEIRLCGGEAFTEPECYARYSRLLSVVVAIMGPLTGIVFSVVLAALLVRLDSPIEILLAPLFSFAINVANLLPFPGHDGYWTIVQLCRRDVVKGHLHTSAWRG